MDVEQFYFLLQEEKSLRGLTSVSCTYFAAIKKV